ncbi:hypothetical protein LguiB_013864 [Lonicera macranthoides]
MADNLGLSSIDAIAPKYSSDHHPMPCIDHRRPNLESPFAPSSNSRRRRQHNHPPQ